MELDSTLADPMVPSWDRSFHWEIRWDLGWVLHWVIRRDHSMVWHWVQRSERLMELQSVRSMARHLVIDLDSNWELDSSMEALLVPSSDRSFHWEIHWVLHWAIQRDRMTAQHWVSETDFAKAEWTEIQRDCGSELGSWWASRRAKRSDRNWHSAARLEIRMACCWELD